jgi:hypothetical protein
MFFPASVGLGWGLPAAIGLQLGDPSRRVLAILGDGALHYTVSALWTAARYHVPVVFVVARNRQYGALKKFTQVMKAPNVPGLDLPDIDITGIASSLRDSGQQGLLSRRAHPGGEGRAGRRPTTVDRSARTAGDRQLSRGGSGRSGVRRDVLVERNTLSGPTSS